MLRKEKQLPGNVIELITVLEDQIAERLKEKPSDEHGDFALRSFFWTGLAYKTLRKLRKLGPNIFVITNDAPEDQTLPYDDSLPGRISKSAFRKHSWTTIRHGFGSHGARFERDLDFDNYIFRLQGGDFSEFAEDFLSARISPTIHWFIFADEEVDISEIEKAIADSSTEEELKVSLCRSCLLLARGFEMDCYIFVTANPDVANLIRDSLKTRS